MKTYLTVIFILITASFCLHATENRRGFFNQYNFNFLTEEEGLPNNFIDDIIRDSNGYIWVATHNGIGRYNGYEFLQYNSTTSPIQLKNDFVHQIIEDPFHRLWIGSERGIDLIDVNRYQPIWFHQELPQEIQTLMNSYIVAIYQDLQHNLWVSTDKQLWCLEFTADGEIKTFYRLEEPIESPVYAIIDLGWGICAGINNQVCHIEKNPGGILKARPLSQLLKPFTPDWKILSMETDGELLWIGTNRGLFKYHHKKQTLQRYRYSSHRPGMLSQAYVTDIALTRQGELIVATLNGLNVYNRQTDSFTYIRHDNSNAEKSLNCNLIHCLLADEENIWVGTEIGGLNLLTPTCLQTYIWPYNQHQTTSFSPNPVNAIGEDKNGNLWIGTVEGGLNKKERGNDLFIHYTFNPDNPNSISTNTVKGILIDSDNHLWAYTWGVGINELDLNLPQNKNFHRHIREDSLGLENDFLSCAYEDTLHHGIWFGTTGGLMFYNKADKHFTRVCFDRSDNEFDAVGSILIDRKKRLWFGTSEGVFIMDLSSFSLESSQFRYVYLKYKLTDESSMQLEKINCIFEDHQGIIWLGSNGNGLYKLAEEKGSTDLPSYVFSNYTRKDGLPANTIVGIVEDQSGRLWMSTNNGITQLNPSTMTFTNYTKEDGLPDNQFSWNAYYYSPTDNLLYFGSINHLVAFNPDVPVMKQQKAEVVLTSLAVSGSRIYPPQDAQTDAVDTRSVCIHERDRGFTIEYSTLNYGNCNRVRYAYRMKDYETQWITTQPGEHMAKYNSLPAGEYTFQVRATDEKGHWSDQITEIQVTVNPYFYKSWWFYLLMIFLAATASVCFYRWKVRMYKIQKKRLEEEVAERTHTLEIQNEQLETMARHIEEITEEKIAFFTNITHEFRTPVTLINGPLKRALQASNDPKVVQQLQIAENNSNYLLSLVNELMDFRKLDKDKVVLELKSTHIPRMIQNILLPFEVFAQERGIQIVTYYRLSTPYWVCDPEYLKKAIINLVSNAIKFTPDYGKISIYIASISDADKQDIIFVDVKDTGHGIAPEELERIFEKFYQSKKSVKYPVYGQSSTGIGLFLCKKIVSLHGGVIQAGNHPGGGASFRMLLPFKKGAATTDSPLEPSPIAKTESNPNDLKHESKKTILVVDDHAEMRFYICSILQDDYQLKEATNGCEALEILQKEKIDLIVSDLMMPLMDGHELSRQVKTNLSISHIPFLMLTAISSESQQKLSYQIGVDEYLCKPFDEEILKLRIRNILSLRDKYKKQFSVSMNCEALNMSSTSKDNLFMESALQLIKKNYSDSEYTLERFVRDMGYSKTLVNQKLQLLTGQTTGQFMKNYRLNIAKETLQQAGSQCSVSDVAYAVGFNDPKYFTKCFKELFGVLPSEYLEKR